MDLTSNQIKYWELQEQKRSNRANEGIKTTDAETKRMEANTNRSKIGVSVYEAETNRAKAQELKRHNKVSEALDFITMGLTTGLKGVSLMGG